MYIATTHHQPPPKYQQNNIRISTQSSNSVPAAAVPQPVQSAAPGTGPARRRPGWLGHRCCWYSVVLCVDILLVFCCCLGGGCC